MLAEMTTIDASEMASAQCHVVIVDDDPQCLVEYRELVEALGYPCHQASDAASALRLIASDARIGLVITDVRMPGMDGLTLLEELSERFMSARPLVAIIITGQSSIDTAICAMRSNAVDMLEKPVSLEGLSASLRRATARWARLAAQFKLLALSQTTARRPETAIPQQAPQDVNRRQPSVDELQAFAARVMKDRQSRSKFFDPQILSGPAWDILLDLAAAGLKGEPVPTSSACASTQVPLSTALRHVNQLVEAGLVKREADPGDKRRTLLELEPHALELMTRYLTSSFEALDPRRPG